MVYVTFAVISAALRTILVTLNPNLKKKSQPFNSQITNRAIRLKGWLSVLN